MENSLHWKNSSSIDGCIWQLTMGVCQYCKHKWTIVAKQFIVLYLCHNGVKSRLKVYYRAQRPGGTVCSITSGHVITALCRTNQQSEQFQHLQVRAEKAQVLVLREDQLRNLNARPQTIKAACWYRAALLWCTYNNIALWRSPERTGKCCLCASEGGRGGVGPRMCLYSPNNSPCWGLVQEWGVERADVIFQRGCCAPACFTFRLTRCESRQEGGGSVLQELLQVKCGT